MYDDDELVDVMVVLDGKSVYELTDWNSAG